MGLLGIRKCDNCGREVEIYHKERLTRKNIFCCKKCEGEYKHKENIRLHPENIFKCEICGKLVYRKKKVQNINKHITCSYECANKLKSIIYKGEGNHQYGLKGSLNASWKSDIKLTNYGYRKIRVLNHPFKDCDGFVHEHRLVAEQYLLNDENSVLVGGKKYLKKEYVVHHKNMDRLNNDVSNLQVMLLADHTRLHAINKREDKL